MVKWEYNVLHQQAYTLNNEDSFDEFLNSFGKDGWELIGWYKNEWFIFKRPIPS